MFCFSAVMGLVVKLTCNGEMAEVCHLVHALTKRMPPKFMQ